MSSKHFCNEDSFTSVDSDDLKEIFSSSSYDRSSIGSIPWAEDAKKQNQQEWDRIERMFYGEEDLPSCDTDLRNEILEWRRVFPQLRINGIKLNSSDYLLHSFHGDFEEILAIHPSNIATISKLKTKNDGNFKKRSYLSGVNDNDNKYLIEDLEKNLRINSVPVVPRKHGLVRIHTENIREKNNSKSSKDFIQSELSNGENLKSSIAQISKSLHHSNAIASKSSNSATYFRMPPIISVIIPQRKYLTHPPKKNAIETKPKSGKTIVLPVIDPIKMSSEKNCRSISAAVTHRTPSDYFLSYSASKLKNFK